MCINIWNTFQTRGVIRYTTTTTYKRYSYRPSRVNIVAQGLSTPDPSLSPTHLSIRRGRATTTHYTHHQVSLVVSRNTTLVSFLGLRIGPACEASLSAGMRRERVSPQIRKKKKQIPTFQRTYFCFPNAVGFGEWRLWYHLRYTLV